MGIPCPTKVPPIIAYVSNIPKAGLYAHSSAAWVPHSRVCENFLRLWISCVIIRYVGTANPNSTSRVQYNVDRQTLPVAPKHHQYLHEHHTAYSSTDRTVRARHHHHSQSSASRFRVLSIKSL
jgi:hypothetical protein